MSAFFHKKHIKNDSPSNQVRLFALMGSLAKPTFKSVGFFDRTLCVFSRLNKQ
ncbi:SmtA protein [Aggregatibacter aphrophilus NJ8700]|nr:SmtA protein [Aggregatibacter aphrophilus NJ8700]